MTTVIDGIKINYETRGEGECVLFLHGWGANIKLFDRLMETVSKKYCAAALDLPGFGESEEPSEPWSVDDYVGFVIKFTRETGLSPVALVGHSFGGRLMIKLLAGGLMPSVKKAVFMDAAGIKPKKSLKQKASLIAYKTGRRIMSIPPMKTLFPDTVENMQQKARLCRLQQRNPCHAADACKGRQRGSHPAFKGYQSPLSSDMGNA